MEAVREVLARMDAIRTTIQGPSRQPEASAAADTHEASFAMMLADAMNGRPYPTSPALGWGAASQTTSTAAPAGLENFSNGQIPVTVLARVVGTDEHLWAPAARAFELMRAGAARDGVTLPLSDGYRHLHDQERLADQLGLYKHGGLAAVPGTSQHGWGRAVDLELDDDALGWMRANASGYGFSETVPREPWHWEYHPTPS